MKSSFTSITTKLIEKYKTPSNKKDKFETKSTNINVLLNRVKLDQKKENRKKIIFTTTTSLGIVLFAFLVF
tara:strand:- start:37 stop:249 length:213 start_codon:yes stop_codon:yes gene_type:complete